MDIVNPGSPATARAVDEPPAAPAAFHWTREGWGHALRARGLEPHAQHLFTSSQLELPANAAAVDRARAWSALAGSLGATAAPMYRVRQVHGAVVRVVRADDPASADATQLPDGDAVVSNVRGSLLAVVVADCVPILLVDPVSRAAAAIHAGWRGTCASVASAAVAAMAASWATDPATLIAAIGPSIGPDDYEVGEALVEAFRDAGHGSRADRWFSRRDARLYLDLWRANADQLLAAGVREDRISVAGMSTFAYPGWFESYRRDGARAGRLVAAIVVP